MINKIKFGLWVYSSDEYPGISAVFGVSSLVLEHLERVDDELVSECKFVGYNYETEELFGASRLDAIYDAVRLSVRTAAYLKGIKEQKKSLMLEWVPYMSAYRVYDAAHPFQTVAYVDSLEDAEKQHPEYEYTVVDAGTFLDW